MNSNYPQILDDLVIETVIGIDPGASGGIAVWTPNTITKTVKMPKNILEMCEYLKYIQGIHKNPLAFLEKVQMFHSDSSSDNYGKQFGIGKLLEQAKEVKDALKILGIPYISVHPMTWQSYLHLRRKDDKSKQKRKNRYKEAAQNMFQDCKVTLWNSDALLLVEFGRRKINYDLNWIKENLPAPVLKSLKFY
jgi:predicted nuclease with RNAse H fold